MTNYSESVNLGLNLKNLVDAFKKLEEAARRFNLNFSGLAVPRPANEAHRVSCSALTDIYEPCFCRVSKWWR